jgi:hypothetical protein
MRIIPYSSGYSLGSANWSLEAGYQKVAILSSTSLSTDVHPAPCDMGVLIDARLVIFSDLVNNGNTNGTDDEQMESLSAIKNRLFSYVGKSLMCEVWIISWHLNTEFLINRSSYTKSK